MHVGILVSKIASPFMDAVIVAMTAGTFLYVGATEIANEEFEGLSNQEKWKRFAALLSGMGLIYLVTKTTEGWEGHHHHSH
jgi:zinc transporter 1/2/3